MRFLLFFRIIVFGKRYFVLHQDPSSLTTDSRRGNGQCAFDRRSAFSSLDQSLVELLVAQHALRYL